MVDEFKNIRNGLFKTLSGLSVNIRGGQEDGVESGEESREQAGPGDARAAKALIAAIFAKAGKSKDEIVHIIAREIGLTVAAMLKEPLAQIAKHQKLQISFELVPKEENLNPRTHGPRSKKVPRHKRRPHTRHRSPRAKVEKNDRSP